MGGGTRQADLQGRAVRAAVLGAAALALMSAGVLHATSFVRLTSSPFRDIYYALFAAGAIGLVWLPGLAAFLASSARRHSLAVSLSLFVLASAMAGWAIFFVWLAWPVLGPWFGAAIYLGSLIAALRQARQVPPASLVPILCAALICGAYTFISLDRGVPEENLQHAMAVRYWTTPDNLIPRLFADRFLQPTFTLDPIFDGWLLSDRPPLMTGMVVWPYAAANPEMRGVAFHVLAVAANGLWAIGLWAFLLAVGVAVRAAAIVVLSTAASGAMFVHTVFTWPKPLTAALAFVAVVLFRCGFAKLSAAAASLSLLGHGAIVFGFPGLLPAMASRLRRYGWRHYLAAICVAAAIYAPWVAFQTFVNPPGDRLLKWHLAGITWMDPRPAGQAILDTYRQLALRQFFENKLGNIRLLLGDPTYGRDLTWQPAWTDRPVRIIRAETSQKIGTAPLLLLIGSLGGLFVARVRRDPRIRLIWAMTGISAVSYVLIEFGRDLASAAWLHTAPFTLVELWIALGALSLVLIDRTWSRAVLIANAVAFFFVWVYGVGQESAFGGVAGQLDIVMRLLALACAAGAVWLALVSPPARQDAA